MESVAEGSLTIRDLPDTLEEVQHFLDTWHFTLSDDGFFFARPESRTLTLDDVRAFLKRLDLICGDGFPRLIAVDFSRPLFKRNDWRQCEAMILAFARRVQAQPIFESRTHDAAFVVLIRSVRNEKKAVRPITTHSQRVTLKQAD